MGELGWGLSAQHSLFLSITATVLSVTDARRQLRAAAVYQNDAEQTGNPSN